MPSVDQIANLPPVFNENSDDEPRWVSSFWFSGKISASAIELAHDTIEHLAHLHPNADEQGFAFGVKGQMDAAVVNAAEVIRPLLSRTVLPRLVRVMIISEEDAMKQLEEERAVKGYDVTQTTFSILGLTTSV